MTHRIFITGASGFIGAHVVPALLARGHEVTALVRKGTTKRFPEGCRVVIGDALNAVSYASMVPPADTFIHLIGVAHPSPSRAHEFVEIDLKSIQEAVPVARAAGIRHFIYLSVPQPLPIMKAYAAVRAQGEALVRASGIPATFVRPFYVLGPGRWWPVVLLPAFWILRLFPPTAATAKRLYPTTITAIVRMICDAVENPPGK